MRNVALAAQHLVDHRLAALFINCSVLGFGVSDPGIGKAKGTVNKSRNTWDEPG
jgi:hypothetical protein